MPYDFFFSYRRADFGAPMREFFTDLGEEVRKLRGQDKNENPAFFDQESIETGDNWDATLLAALQQSCVLVPMYSPAYFKSEYCGKEWQLFQLRREAYALAHGGLEPAVIRPVVWIPIRKDNKLTLPDNVGLAVTRVQYTWGEEDSAINQEGLEQMVRLKAGHAQLYWDFVRDFAEGIKDAIEQYIDALAPQDRIGLVTIPRGGLNVGLTTDRARFQSAVAELSGRAAQSETDADAACRTRQVLDALMNVFRGAASGSPARYLRSSGSPQSGSSQRSVCCRAQVFPASRLTKTPRSEPAYRTFLFLVSSRITLTGPPGRFPASDFQVFP